MDSNTHLCQYQVKDPNISMKFGTILMITFVFFALFSHTYSGTENCQEEVTMQGKCGIGFAHCIIAVVQKVGKPIKDAKCLCDYLGNNSHKCTCTYACLNK
ncbi:hypothetical protein PIB30_005020 [Stylosanthes scabra]|uniref:Uncharacterized protein n=1 Tax=Stylosanthes scabra TaxID=79078 RepID=A0ABU6Y2P2_9FABA|nr:hypothetical protein [Stylosanthes scabra]